MANDLLARRSSAQVCRGNGEGQEAEQEAAEKERSKSSPWRPQDRIYAIPGKDLDDRCLKSGDAIIGLAERSISSGADKCSVTFIRDEPDFIRLFVTCSAGPNPQDPIGRTGDGSNSVSRSSETIILKKNVDETVLLQKTPKRRLHRFRQAIVLLQRGRPAEVARWPAVMPGEKDQRKMAISTSVKCREQSFRTCTRGSEAFFWCR